MMTIEKTASQTAEVLFKESGFYLTDTDKLYAESLLAYDKIPASVSELLEYIENKGCIITDRNTAAEFLHRVDYFRFKAYFIPFSKDGAFAEGVTFEKIQNIYEFDRRLRGIILGICEIIEIKLRSILINFHVHKYGATGYLKSENYSDRHDHETFISKLKGSLDNNDKKLPVQHHVKTHDGFVPLWVAMEYFSFGQLSFFYSDLTTEDQKELSLVITEGFSEQWYKALRSWMRCIVDLRNECAHFARLYYKQQTNIPYTPKEINVKLKRNLGKRIFDYLIILKYLFPDKARWDNEFVSELDSLIERYNSYISLHHIGFPENWKDILQWDS